MGTHWTSDPRLLGKIIVNEKGKYEVYTKADSEYYRGYRTRTYKSFDRAKRRSEKVLAKDKARDDKIRAAQEILRNSERDKV